MMDIRAKKLAKLEVTSSSDSEDEVSQKSESDSEDANEKLGDAFLGV